MYCQKCGKPLAKEEKSCGNCGQSVGAATSDLVQEGFSQPQGIERIWSGRIGRLNYFLGSMLPTAAIFVLVSLWGVVQLLQATFSSSSLDLVGTLINALVGLLITIFVVLFFIFHTLLGIRRSHDVGITGWFILLTYIPYLGIVPALYLLIKKGESSVNLYGNPPSERKFFADVFNY